MFLGRCVDDAITLYYRRILEHGERLSPDQVKDAFWDGWKAAGEAEIVSGVKAVIAEMGSPTMKDMGTVMKNVMAKFAAQGMRVDGKLVSDAVKKELAGT